MQLFNLTVAITWFFGLTRSLTSAEPNGPSTSLQHVRRDQRPDPPFIHTYIMKDSLEEITKPLAVYRLDGAIVFTFQKDTYDLHRGESKAVLKGADGFDMLTLKSEDDYCGKNSHYVNHDGDVVIEVHPRGPKSDQWIVTKTVSSGEARLKFKRNITDKNGRIYDANGAFVAELLSETHYEPWLSPEEKGVRTYTIRTTATAPEVELVAMMGLVMFRTDACGL